MADTTALKNRIRAAIKANDNQEITGPVLQQALLDIVDELNGATETEASQRQSADNTLQQNITAEKNRAEGAESTLQQNITAEKNRAEGAESSLQTNINNEATARQNADTQLNNLITGIKNNIDNGYVYAGIATPSAVPVSGKVFYMAMHAGTYTNFGDTAVTEGITILKYNGTSWVKEQVLFTDDEPKYNSSSIVKSEGTYKAINDSVEAEVNYILNERRGTLTYDSVVEDSYLKANGTVGSVTTHDIVKYTLSNIRVFHLKASMGSVGYGFFYNSNNEIIGIIGSDSIDKYVYVPVGCAYIMFTSSHSIPYEIYSIDDLNIFNNNNLDFTHFTGDKIPYNRGILFAGIVYKDNYEGSKTHHIYGLSANRNSDGNLYFFVEDDNQQNKFMFSAPLTDYTGYKQICISKTNSDVGTLYVIVNIQYYIDYGKDVVWSHGTNRVYINAIEKTDARITAFGNTIPLIQNKVNNVDKYPIEGSQKFIESNGVAESLKNLSQFVFTGFKGTLTYDSVVENTYLNSSGEEKPNTGKNVVKYILDGVVFLHVTSKMGSVGYGFFYDSDDNIIGTIGTGSVNDNMMVPFGTSYIRFTVPNSESYAVNVVSDVNIFNQNNLDFSHFTGDKTPYLAGILFAGIVYNDSYEGSKTHHIYGLSAAINGGTQFRLQVEDDNEENKFLIKINLSDYTGYKQVCLSYTNDSVGTLYAIIDLQYYIDYGKDVVWSHGTNRVYINAIEKTDARITAFANNDKRTIVWFGTSIPAGSDSALGLEGIGTTYPEIVASLLDYICYNEAIGSSKALGGKETWLSTWTNTDYDHYKRMMGNKISDLLYLLSTIITIDDNNQSVSWAGNTLNINLNGFPYSSSNLPTYAQAVDLRNKILFYSYEIKLISKYLDSTGDYLKTVMRSSDVTQYVMYSGDVYELLYTEDMAYRTTPDYFVFDHGTNDYKSGVDMASQDITSRARDTFYGAMNTYIDAIRLYAPHKTICIITDYGSSRRDLTPDNDPVIIAQTKLARYWQYPLIETYKKVPFNGVIVTTCGYWDNGTDQKGAWHNSGFTFTVNGTNWSTNNGLIQRYYSGSSPDAQTVIEHFNIREINGVKVYDIPQKQLFFKDGLHPSSNSSGDALVYYAKTIAPEFEMLPVCK